MIKSKDIYDALDRVSMREDVAAYVKLLRRNFLESPGDWGNTSLPDYLDAIGNVLEDNRPGFFQRTQGPQAGQPTWYNVANLVWAGTDYE